MISDFRYETIKNSFLKFNYNEQNDKNASAIFCEMRYDNTNDKQLITLKILVNNDWEYVFLDEKRNHELINSIRLYDYAEIVWSLEKSFKDYFNELNW